MPEPKVQIVICSIGAKYVESDTLHRGEDGVTLRTDVVVGEGAVGMDACEKDQEDRGDLVGIERRGSLGFRETWSLGTARHR